jgi:hypothetical protein
VEVVQQTQKVLRVRLLHEVHSSDDQTESDGGQQHALTWPEVLDLWVTDTEFQDTFSGVLADAPFESFFWETPPLCSATSSEGQPFEMTLMDAENGLLASEGDESGFLEHFNIDNDNTADFGAVRVFPNFTGDALLIAPECLAPRRHYGHLGAFVRGAPVCQQRELWAELGAAGKWRLEERCRSPVWISTDGGRDGVPWLHLRIDSCPKHIKFAPYRKVPCDAFPGVDDCDPGITVPVNSLLSSRSVACHQAGENQGDVSMTAPSALDMVAFLAGEAVANARSATRNLERCLAEFPPTSEKTIELRRSAALAVEKATRLMGKACELRDEAAEGNNRHDEDDRDS